MKSSFFLFVAALLALTNAAFACDCGPAPARESIEKATAIFEGRVISVKPENGLNTVSFNVSKTWKGVEGATIEVVNDIGRCAASLKVGKDYLVYAYLDHRQMLATNMCSRTTEIALAAADLEALQAANPPVTLPTANQARYQLTDLGALTGFPYSRAYGINESGEVVGQIAVVEPEVKAQAAIWKDGKVRVIEPLAALPLGIARGINDSSHVVGGSEIENYGSHGFDFVGLPSRAYQWQIPAIPALSELQSRAYAINNRGQIVGELENKAVVWNAGEATKLATATGVFRSQATAINAQGQVAGIAQTATGRGAVWWNKGEMQPLGTLPGDDQSIANGINDIGQIVGSSGAKGSYWNQPFLWQNEKMELLTPLDGRLWINQVMDINNRGQIVGCGMKDGVYMHAVLWEKKMGMGWPSDLNDLIDAGSGLVLMKAYAINDKGQIVGEARDAKGQIHAFLLTPRATPAT